MPKYEESLDSVIALYVFNTSYNGIPIDELLEEIRDNTTGLSDLMIDGKFRRIEECHVLMIMN